MQTLQIGLAGLRTERLEPCNRLYSLDDVRQAVFENIDRGSIAARAGTPDLARNDEPCAASGISTHERRGVSDNLVAVERHQQLQPILLPAGQFENCKAGAAAGFVGFKLIES